MGNRPLWRHALTRADRWVTAALYQEAPHLPSRHLAGTATGAGQEPGHGRACCALQAWRHPVIHTLRASTPLLTVVTITGFPSVRHLTFGSLILQVLHRSHHGRLLCDLLYPRLVLPSTLVFLFLFHHTTEEQNNLSSTDRVQPYRDRHKVQHNESYTPTPPRLSLPIPHSPPFDSLQQTPLRSGGPPIASSAGRPPLSSISLRDTVSFIHLSNSR